MSSPLPRHILFVDDDVSWLEQIVPLFQARSQNAWTIHQAQTAAQALSLLETREMALVVVDLHMPVMDGRQLILLLRRKYPALQKVILTGVRDPAEREACLREGADFYLHKPCSSEEFDTLFATLNELVNLSGNEGFRGVLRSADLQDVIQLECLARNSSILHIANRHVRGSIYIHQGNVIHAESADQKGEAALYQLLGLAGGEFSLKPLHDPPAQTICGHWEFLLIEAARLRDEAAGQGTPTGAADHQTATSSAPLSAPQMEMGSPSADPILALETPSDPAPVVRIAELLITAPEGALIYSQGDVSPVSLELLAAFRHCGQGVQTALGQESLERVVIHQSGGRIVADFNSDRHLLVRSLDPIPMV